MSEESVAQISIAFGMGNGRVIAAAAKKLPEILFMREQFPYTFGLRKEFSGEGGGVDGEEEGRKKEDRKEEGRKEKSYS